MPAGPAPLQPYWARFKHPHPEMPGAYSFPFKDGEIVMVMGEISNMPGCVNVANDAGKFFLGLPKIHFIRLKKFSA
jgi:hypothetical protein